MERKLKEGGHGAQVELGSDMTKVHVLVANPLRLKVLSEEGRWTSVRWVSRAGGGGGAGEEIGKGGNGVGGEGELGEGWKMGVWGRA